MKSSPGISRSLQGSGKRKPTSKLTVHRTALFLLAGALVVTFTSIPMFLLILHGVDSSIEESGEMPSLSIRAIHMLQQAKVRGLHGSLSESLKKPAKVCVVEHDDLQLRARHLLPTETSILDNILGDLELDDEFVSAELGSVEPPLSDMAKEASLFSKGSNDGSPGRPVFAWQRSLLQRGESFRKQRAMGLRKPTGKKALVQTWFERQKLCRRWVSRLTTLLQDAGNDSLILGLQYYLGSDGDQEPRREGWNNRSASLEGAMVEVEPLTLALAFWGNSSFVRGGVDPASSGNIAGEVKNSKGLNFRWPFKADEAKSEGKPFLREIVRVETLARPAREQIAMSSNLLALAPEGAEVVAIEMCGPVELPLLGVNNTKGLGIHLSLYRPNGGTNGSVTATNVERSMSAILKRCELRQAPLLRYVIPADNSSKLAQGLEDMPFPWGQLAVSWESNCNVVHHRVIICRGAEGSLCSEAEEKDCSTAEDPGACVTEQEAMNHRHHPDFTVTTVTTKQVSPTSWIHSAFFPALQPGQYRYRVRSGGKWSHQYGFRVVGVPQLRKLVHGEGEGKVDKGSKIYTTRGGHLSFLRGTSRGNKKEGTIGKKGVLGRKGYQRGPIGVSSVDVHVDDWVHIALVSDSQSGVSVFRKHLAHIRTHRPSADMLVHLGDRVQHGASQQEWAYDWNFPLWDNRVGQYAAHLGIVGNHDVDSLGLAAAFAPLASRATWYSVVIGNCLWIALDSNLSPAVDSSQSKWLKQTLEDLALARKEGVAPSFAIVMVHIAPFIEFWDPKTWVKKEERRWGEWVRIDWVPLFEKYKVDLVISGHSHVYQRGERNGVMYAIMGGGGGALDMKRVENWKMYRVTHHDHHYVWVDMSAGKLSWTAYDLANNPIDHVLFEADSFPNE